MSNETKWTPGPWEVEPRDIGSGAGINGPNGEAVVWWASEDEHDNGIGSEHDAHLIAAAPELYEALSGMLDQFDADECVDFLNEADYIAVKSARAALAKARGES